MKPSSLKTTLDVAEWALRAYRRITESIVPDDPYAKGADDGERAAYYNLLVGILGTPDSSQPDQIIDIFTDRLRDGQRQAGLHQDLPLADPIEPGAEGEPLAVRDVLLPGHKGAGPAHDPHSDARLLGRLWVQIERAIAQLEAGEPRQALDTLLATRSWPGFDDPR